MRVMPDWALQAFAPSLRSLIGATRRGRLGPRVVGEQRRITIMSAYIVFTRTPGNLPEPSQTLSPHLARRSEDQPRHLRRPHSASQGPPRRSHDPSRSGAGGPADRRRPHTLSLTHGDARRGVYISVWCLFGGLPTVKNANFVYYIVGIVTLAIDPHEVRD
jgi:hypothetical protein